MAKVSSQSKNFLPMTIGPLGIVTFVYILFFGLEEIAKILLLDGYPAILHLSAAADAAWNSSFAAQFWLVLLTYPLVGLLLWLWFLRGQPQSRLTIGWKMPTLRNFLYALSGLFLIYAIYLGSYLVMNLLIPAFHASLQYSQQLNITAIRGPIEILLGFFMLSILDPIIEEAMFRGFIFSGFKQRFPVIISAILTSFLFAAPHMLQNVHGLIYSAALFSFIMSMVLCWVRQKTGNIVVGMVVHGTLNFISLLGLIHVLR